MRSIGIVCQSLSLLSCLSFFPYQLESQARDLPAKTSIIEAGGKHVEPATGRRSFSLEELPLQFEKNVGQAGGQARFLARGGGYTLLIVPDGLVIDSRQAGKEGVPNISMHLLGTLPGELAGQEQTVTRTNYYIGKDPSSWHLNVPSYRSVAYQGVYKGIDLIYHGSGNQLEYDFVVSPGADAGQVRMRFDGLKPALQGKDLSFGDGSPVSIRALNAYQVIEGEKKAVDAAWQIQGDQASIHLGPYDRDHELVIDPIIFYGTYIGGSGSESAVSIVPAAAANAFYIALASSSASITEPAPGSGYAAPSNPNTSGTDTLILELGTTGDSLTPVSPSVIRKRPSPDGVTLPPSDCSAVPCATLSASPTTIVSGETSTLTWSSTNSTSCTASGGWTGTEATSGSLSVSPTTTTTYTLTCVGTGATSSPASATVTISPTVLIYSATYIGGANGNTIPEAMVSDSAFNVYITGTTTASASLPQLGTQVCSSACPSFVTKLNSSLALQYSSGLPVTSSNGIAVDSDEDIYLTGKATAGSLTIPSADSSFQSQVTGGSALTSGSHAFLLELDPTGATVFASYIGGSGSDQGTSIALSGTSVYVAGQTSSADLPTTSGAAQQQYAGYGTGTGTSGTGNTVAPGSQKPGSLNGDAFVVAAQNLSTDPALTFSTYLGGSGDDYASSIAVDPFGNIVVVGSTTSVFPTTDITPLTFYLTTVTTGQSNYARVLQPRAKPAVVSDVTSNVTMTPIQASSSDTKGSQLAFVYGLSPTGSKRFLDLLGGVTGDIAVGESVAVDSAGAIYAVGATNSVFTLPSTGVPQQNFLGGSPAAIAISDYLMPSSGMHTFLAEIDPTGTGLLEATLAGGSGPDQANALSLSPGVASIVGSTSVGSSSSSANLFDSAQLNPSPAAAIGENEGFFAQEATQGFCNLSLTSQVGPLLTFSGPCSPGTTGGFLTPTVNGSTLAPQYFPVSSSTGTVPFDLSPYPGQVLSTVVFSGFGPQGAAANTCDRPNPSDCAGGHIQGVGSITYGGGTTISLFNVTSAPLSVSIICASANCTYNSLPDTIPAGQTINLNATVTNAMPGTVTWTSANTPQGKLTASTTPSTSATFTTGTTGGATTVIATSVADGKTTGTIQVATLETPVFNLAVTNAVPIVYGQPVSVSVSASGNYTTPSGPITYQVDGGTSVAASLSSGGVALINLSGLSAGPHSVSVAYPGNYQAGGFFTPATKTVSFNITPAVLTVQAANASVNYGQPIPALTSYTISGFVNGDSQSVVSGTATETTSATSTSVPGSYSITFSVQGLAATNYTFNYVNGSLTIASLGTAPPAPSISPASGSYTSAQTVTIGDLASGAKIYYTTDGTPPSTGSTLYTGSFAVGTSTTVRAIAAAPGYDNADSAPVSAAFTLGPPTLSTASLPFGVIVQGQSSSAQTVTFTNQGLNQLTNVTLSIGGTNSGDFAVNPATTCGSSVAAGSTCSIAVVFAPLGTGTRSATLQVAHAGIGAPQSVALAGTGLEPVVITSNKVSQLIAGTTFQFTSNQPVSWTASAGTISSSGFFTAPNPPPSPAAVTITATSSTNAQLVATSVVTIVPVPVITVPSSTSLAAGQSVSIPLSIGPGTGIAGESYTLACTPATLPTDVSCVFNPNPLVDAAGGASGTLELTSNALTSKLPQRHLPWNRLPAGGSLIAVACCLIIGIRRNLRGRIPMLMMELIASAALISLAACGTSGSFKIPPATQQYVTGTYTIDVSVTGASSGAPDFNQTLTTVPVNVTIK
jgi:hypothetical protein